MYVGSRRCAFNSKCWFAPQWLKQLKGIPLCGAVKINTSYYHHCKIKWNLFLHSKMTTREEAKEIIEEIANEDGYLDRQMMDDIGQFNAEYRRRIDENWLKKENAASHPIKV